MAERNDPDMEGQEESGRSGGRKRLLLLIVELCLLSISALLIGAFLYTAEVKRPGGQTAAAVSADQPPPPVEPIPLDISRQRRNALRAEMAELMEEMRFRMEHTQLEDVRWIVDTRTPDGFFSNTFYSYLGQSDGKTWGRLVAGGILKRNIFLQRVVVSVDGIAYTVEIDFNDREEQELGHIDAVYEFVDIPLDPYLDALRHAAKGRDVHVSLQGKGGSHDFRLTYDQLGALQRVIRLYDILQTLEAADAAAAPATNAVP